MTKANTDIREKIEMSGLRYWQVAAEYGLTDGNFSRLLRTELPSEKKQRILDIIERLKVGAGE